jgi:hypothetical protein
LPPTETPFVLHFDFVVVVVGVGVELLLFFALFDVCVLAARKERRRRGRKRWKAEGGKETEEMRLRAQSQCHFILGEGRSERNLVKIVSFTEGSE